MWSLTLPRAKRISGSKKFRFVTQKRRFQHYLPKAVIQQLISFLLPYQSRTNSILCQTLSIRTDSASTRSLSASFPIPEPFIVRMPLWVTALPALEGTYTICAETLSIVE
jgi:hypothetical protein